MTLPEIMLSMVLREAPYLATKPAALARYKESIATLHAANEAQAAEGALVSTEADMALLTTIQWYESRFRVDTPDGDCFQTITGRKTCWAVGPMQVSKAFPQWVKGWSAEERETWAGIGVKQLRDPETNVRVGYGLLKRWKTLCGGERLGTWITAYGSGKCPRGGRVDREGKRRCATTRRILVRLEALPEDWKC
jgi:hypothetical protein